MSAVSELAKETALWGDRLLRPAGGVTVLIYHRVGGGTSSSVDLEPAEFAWQMRHLAENCSPMTLDEGLSRLRAGDSTPGVVVTFDDGTRDFTEVAVPIMVEYGIPSLLYAETHPITTGCLNAAGQEPTTWEALARAVSTAGVEVGSHTHTHRLLHSVEPSVVSDELDRSIETINEFLGVRPRHFAYPKAVDGSPVAQAEIRSRFSSAALGGGRSNLPGTDPFRLQRTPIQRTDSRAMFVSKVRGGMRLEGILRESLASRRYRHLER